MQSSGFPTGSVVLVYGAILVLVVGRFLVRELRERKLALSRIFVAPAILGVLALYLLSFSFTHFAATTTLLAGETCITLGVGSAIGVAVGHFSKVRLGDKPGIVYLKGSWQTVAIWLGALALRFLARYIFRQDDLGTQFSLNAALVVMITAALALLRYKVLIDARELRKRGISDAVPVV
jgi:hypothetical protein